ncbi:premnaspirodiene oxygenase-like [Triticum dicoccoides]|uniref:premnaspirodiene oxygenase-like n=1 Tax=Triticum dicoccoides TaxID=85692 RepID=UPI000E7BD191|nr:premnaspirodiene oxygenase-like [Triticum dicoccoides]
MAAVLPICLLLFLLLAIPLTLFKSRRPAPHRGPGGRAVRLPPGPWALPVIGHLHHLAGALPHRALRDLGRRHGPLMMLRLGELDAVVASSPDAAREIMKTHDASFASRPLTSMQQMAYGDAEGLIFAPYGDAWRQLRKICTVEILSSRRVQSFRPAREEELGRLLRSVAAASASSSPVNLSERISAYVADSTVRAIVGGRFKQRDTYLKMLQEGLKIVPGMTLPDIFPSSRLVRLLSSVPGRIQRHSQGMKLFMDTIIQEHQENRGPGGDGDKEEDLLDVLLRLQKEADSQYPLTTDNIKTVMLDMFGAGSETSATTLQWAMAELIRNPRVMRKAQDEVRQQLAGHGKVKEADLTDLRYLGFVIKETLRMHPPAPLLLPRRCGSPCQVLGLDVPEGVMVIVNAWAIGMDPVHWDAPEKFAPERFEQNGRDFKGADFEFVPFGGGRRICPGMAFGLAHVELALAALLFHFDWELPGGVAAEDLDMTEEFGVTARLRSDLVVVAVPRVAVATE